MNPQTVHRCSNPVCARTWPRPVAFCPYCGTASARVSLQKNTAGDATGAASPAAPAPAGSAATGMRDASGGVASSSAQATTPANPPAHANPPTPASTNPSAANPPAANPPAPVAVNPSAVASARPLGAPASTLPGGPASGSGVPGAAPPGGAPPAASPASSIKPIPPIAPRKSWWRWLLLALLFGSIWGLIGKSSTEALQAKSNAVQTLIDECKLEQATHDLQELKKQDPDQFRRLRDAITHAKAACESKHARERDFEKTRAMVSKALEDEHLDKAAYDKLTGRMNWFDRQWNDTEATRPLRQQLDARYAKQLLDLAERCATSGDWACVKLRLAQWDKLKPADGAERAKALREQMRLFNPAPTKPQPAAKAHASSAATTGAKAPNPPPAAPASSAIVNKLIRDAEGEIGYGNYKGAFDKMEMCLTLIDKGNPTCQQLKKKAERLNKDMLHCVSGGHEWIGDNCVK